MCNTSYRFSKEFFAVKPLKHIGLSDMEELIHMKIHELGTEGYFKSLAEKILKSAFKYQITQALVLTALTNFYF